MKQFKNGKTRYDADDIANAMSGTGPLTEGGASFLAAIVGAPDPVRHPEEFAAWQKIAQGTITDGDSPAPHVGTTLDITAGQKETP